MVRSGRDPVAEVYSLIPENWGHMVHIGETRNLSVGIIPAPGGVEAGGTTGLPNTSNSEGWPIFKRYGQSVAMPGTPSADEPVAR